MLRSDLKYVCLDFETTGLDTEKDEAIQIGIVRFDHTRKITDSFSSYIKPQKDMQELRDIVRVVTGLNLEDVMHAPTFEQIADKVASFFDEKTVIIGHNVSFDLRFLQRYSNAPYLISLDTFPLAQALMPFSPSYALEVLEKNLSAPVSPEAAGIASSHHDALYDAYATYKLFHACIDRIRKIHDTYPQIDVFMSRSTAALSSVIQKESSGLRLTGSIPMLSKTEKAEKKLLDGAEIDKEDFEDKAKYFIGNTPFKELCKKLPKGNVIYAFSQRHKATIARNTLHEIGLTHIDTNVHYTFDKELLGLFFRKEEYDQGELYFILKYFFHVISAHSNIDLTTQYDWKIYHALKEKSSLTKQKSVEIMTHDYLYEKLRDQEIMPYTTIFFFDQDWRYDTHMKWEQKPFDLHMLLQITDSLIYKNTLLNSKSTTLRSALHTKIVIFIGVWQTEVGDLMKDVSNNSVEIDNVTTNTYFYKSNLLRQQIDEMISSMEGKVADEEYAAIQEKWKRFTEIISSSCAISTKLYGEEIHFLVRKLHSFLDYSEFQELFGMYQTVFLSDLKKDRPTLTTTNKPIELPQLLPRPGKEKIDYSARNIYVFSNNKQTSQELLVWLHNHKPEKHRVHGENITGGKGKNIFIIKESPYNVIIGGYDFYLQCIAQKVSIDKIYTLCINGPLEQLISTDLVYYGNVTHP